MTASAEKSEAERVGESERGPEVVGSAFADAPFMLAIFVINVIVFAAEILYAGSSGAAAGDSFGSRVLAALLEVPEGVGMTFGANYASATLYDGRIDTLLASCFVHWSLWHIGFNLYALRAVGPFLERIVGTGRASLLYLGSGIVGSMFSALEGWLWQQERVGAGASGAICGIIGAALVVGYRTAGWQSPLLRMTARWLVITLVVGKLIGADNAAHLGGAFSGAAIALLWERGPERPNRKTIATGLAAGLLTATIAGVTVRDVRDPFAAQTVLGRLQMANAALKKGDCETAWNATLAARRVGRRDPQTLHAIYLVRSACGIPET